ncbi:hypothetical protein [Microcoleus sp. N9_A1]|uniref:hypothetical protein n=1 Tax=Microcoleus sp. N9_A1 TaxID=3055380 RepID=UPI002FD21498
MTEIALHKIRQQAVIGIKFLENANVDSGRFNVVNFFGNANFQTQSIAVINPQRFGKTFKIYLLVVVGNILSKS